MDSLSFPFLSTYGGPILFTVVAILVFRFVLSRLAREQTTRDRNDVSRTNLGSASSTPAKRKLEDAEGYVFGTLSSNVFDQGPDQGPDVGRTAAVGGSIHDDEGAENEEGDTAEGREARFVPYDALRFEDGEMTARSREFYELMNRRRTVRMFSDRKIPKEVVENIILTAGTSPSGAHTEPWTFVVVSDSALKAEIRHITELEEQINYERRMGDRWLSDVRQLNTSWQKSYLETAPYLILVFVQVHGLAGDDGRRRNHYYHQISVAMATGLLMAAIHNAGLVTVTSTPMNAGMRFQALLDRPPNEKFVMMLPIGFAADDAAVPDLHRKPLQDIIVWK